MVADPVPHVRRAAHALRDAGATIVAGHSAHVFHGVDGNVLYDLGDFLDDYATSALRNDLGLLFLVELDELGPRRLEAVPLALDFCRTPPRDGRRRRPDRRPLPAGVQRLRHRGERRGRSTRRQLALTSASSARVWRLTRGGRIHFSSSTDFRPWPHEVAARVERAPSART